MTSEVKIIAALALAIVIIGGLWWYGEHRYNGGLAAGKAEIQTQWDANKAAIEALADQAKAQAIATEAAAQKRNQEITHDYQAQLSAARASAGSLAQRLRDYQARAAADRRPVSPAANNPGALAGAAAPSVGRLNDATGAALAECAEVRAGYIALIDQIKTQL